MQAESSLWGRRRVVGSKLKHDGTLGYISRGAARRSGLNPAGWHRYVPIVVVAAIIVIALAALGYAGDGASLGAMFKSPELAHAGTELVEGAQDQTGVAPSAVWSQLLPPLPMLKRTKAGKATTPMRVRRAKRQQLHRQDKLRVGQQIWDGAFQRVRRSLERRNIHHVFAAGLGLGKRALGIAQDAVANTAQASVGGQTPAGQQLQALGRIENLVGAMNPA